MRWQADPCNIIAVNIVVRFFAIQLNSVGEKVIRMCCEQDVFEEKYFTEINWDFR